MGWFEDGFFMPLHLKSKKEYEKYLKNLAKENQPRTVPKSPLKLIQYVKECRGMVDALMGELISLKYDSKRWKYGLLADI